MSYHAKLIKGGKIVIPAQLRRELGFKEGERLVIERDGTGMVVRSYAVVVRDIQRQVRAMIKTPFTVDDFLAEKYAEAERENRE
jgi:AbrB family transcriptional regulator, stage V sporulation protein T